MRDESPIDLIAEATDSLGAVCDLLNWGYSADSNKRDMHLVDGERLCTLLTRCQRDLRTALDELLERDLQKAMRRAGRI